MRKAGFSLMDIESFSEKKRATWKKSKRDELRSEGKGSFGVYLWQNKIARYNTRTKRLSVSSAGWQTPTTKTRLNKLLEPTNNQVQQKNYSWYMNTPKGKRVPFKNWMSYKV